MKIEIDKSDLRKVETLLTGVKNGAKKVLVRSINKTLTNVRTKAVRAVGKELNLPAKRIRKDFRISKANFQRVAGEVNATGKPIGLGSFSGVRQVKKGVSVKVKKGNRRAIIKHAFLARTGKLQTANVYWRKYKGPRKPIRGITYGALPKKYRFPIERLTGPRIEDIFDSPEVMPDVLEHAQERIGINMAQELNYELTKLK